MASTIRMCTAGETQHDRPQYTLQASCPRCGESTRPAAPARFDPADPYGKYRRATKRRREA